MVSAVDMEFVRAVLALGNAFNDYGNLWESIWWRTDDEYAPVTFFVNCNDLFCWASADSETIKPESLPLLIESVSDVRAALGVPVGRLPREDVTISFHKWWESGSEGALLFCCRVRAMRPQRPYYEEFDPRLWPLFDTCGPERTRASEG